VYCVKEARIPNEPPFLSISVRWESVSALSRDYKAVDSWYTHQLKVSSGENSSWGDTWLPYDVVCISCACVDDHAMTRSSPRRATRVREREEFLEDDEMRVCKRGRAFDAQFEVSAAVCSPDDHFNL